MIAPSDRRSAGDVGPSFAVEPGSMPIPRIRRVEDTILRGEGAVAVAVLVAMLLLAAYNIVYRNLLVPMQRRWATSGPPVAVASPPVSAPAEALGAGSDGGAGGFGGGFGEGGVDGAGGFGGGFGEGGADGAGGFGEGGADGAATGGGAPGEIGGTAAGGGTEAAPGGGSSGGPVGPAVTSPAGAGAPRHAGGEAAGGFGGGGGDDAGGFGGGFGGGGGDDAGGFGGGFGAESAPSAGAEASEAEAELARLVEHAPPPEPDPQGPVGGPPPPGSFEARAVAFVDALKLDWIDIVLRQGVILLGFFGAAFATRRRKHINIDALSKLLPDRARRIVAVLVDAASVAVCLMLATAGWRLVAISREFPKELVSWADEWTFQLMFPVGFGLLAFHFTVRVVESIAALRGARAPEGGAA